MKLNEMISTSPIDVEKSVRGDEIRVLTTCKAGKIIPVLYSPLLREDRVSRGQISLRLEMKETVHPLMNAVNVTAYAHFVPYMAFERFKTNGMDAFNRSYKKVGEPHNGVAIPFVHPVDYDRDAEIYKTMGIHWKDGDPMNSSVLEAYNTVVNFRREARSQRLPGRGLYDTTLAEAFWKHSNMWHIVPDFEAAMIDGEVELTMASGRLPIYARHKPDIEYNGQGFTMPATAFGVGPTLKDVEGVPYHEFGNEIFAELRDTGVRLSLANLELAKQTVAFAKLRNQYSGLDDDHIIDLLMDGVRVPDEALKQPILLDKQSTIFGYNERHAMDGASLDMSVTTGKTSLALNFRTPAMNVGGVILVTLEIVPEQLFERQFDTFLGTMDPDKFPSFVRDYLDPEKVDIVPNKFVDVEHSIPEGAFGYAPLNHAWKRSITRIGGRFFRQNPDTWVEDRQRFWSVEQLDPSLTTDFYMVRDLPHSVFLDTISDPFEVLALGSIQIVGDTVFGKTLSEDNGDYEAVAAKVDTSRISQE